MLTSSEGKEKEAFGDINRGGGRRMGYDGMVMVVMLVYHTIIMIHDHLA